MRTVTRTLFIMIAGFACICGCKKSPGVYVNPNSTYYFKVDVDEKSIELSEAYDYTRTDTSVFLLAHASQSISLSGVSNRCADSGNYCFRFSAFMLAQQTGTYTPASFSLIVPVNNVNTSYQFSSGSPGEAALSITISSITPGSSQVPGIVSGTFSGTCMKQLENQDSVIAIVPITGSFAMPNY